MPGDPTKLSQFWQELKRRKVVRVITVYAAVAFVILELTDIVAPSLGLPDWTLNFIIILLCVGFIIAVILSWIYDIHPEGGVVKTEPVGRGKAEDSPKSSNSWKIASYVSFVVILGLVVLNIIPRANRTLDLPNVEKSIAVLPFRNISPDSANQYLLDGIMDAILNYLTGVENLRVIANTSVEQYRGSSKTISEIGKELNVNYILEGSGQRYEDNFRLTTKLSNATNSTLIWSNPYDREVKDMLEVQSEIAQRIVSELQTKLTEKDRETLNTRPTFSEKAYHNYLIAGELHRTNFPRAIELLEEALEIDSLFVEAYVLLSGVYRSTLGMTRRSMSSEDAYKLALPPLLKALEIDPSKYRIHEELGNFKYWFEWDFKGAEEEYLLAAEIRGYASGALGSLLIQNRRFKEALSVAKDLRDFNPTITDYLTRLSYLFLGEYEEALNVGYESTQMVPGEGGSWIGRIFMAMGDYDQAIANIEYTVNQSRDAFYLSDLAICYNVIGKKEEADDIIQELIDRYNQGEPASIAFGLGKIYSGTGEVESALEWLEKSYQDRELEMIWLYADPAFECLQDNEQYIDLLERVGFDV